MNKAVILQQIYTDGIYADAIALTLSRNLKYAKMHAMDYQFHFGNIVSDWEPGMGGWAKIALIQFALAQGYTFVIWLDADTMIKDMNTDLRDGCPADGIGAVLHAGPPEHYNVGALYLKNTERVREFVNIWALWYPGPRGWREQAMFNLLNEVPKISVVQPIDAKWNSTKAAQRHVENAVVEGFHGEGDPARRIELMREFLKGLDNG